MRNKTIAALALGLALFTTACGLADSEINEACLVYSGGVTEDKVFQEILPPGSTAKSVGLGSETYCYRIDQRSFIAAPDNAPARDTGLVRVVSRDETRMLVDYQLYFTVNQDEKIFRAFHENLGVKTEAWRPEGWTRLLNEYFAPQIERSVEAAALKYTWRELYATEEARRGFSADVVITLKRNIQEVIGADYFCGPSYQRPGDTCGDFTFTVGKPVPENDDIVTAIEEAQTAVERANAQKAEANAQIETAKARAEVARAEAAARQAEIEGFGTIEEYNRFQCIQAGCNPYQPTIIYGAPPAAPQPPAQEPQQ